MKDNAFTLFGEVEADETAVGGKRHGKRGRGAEGKTIVFGQLQCEGKMNTVIVPNVKAVTLMPHFRNNIAKGTRLMMDEAMELQEDSQDARHGT